MSDDTIAAIATAAGVGGVGIVRLSGPQAIAIAAEALGLELAACQSWTVMTMAPHTKYVAEW